jgi:hypothetical protein
VARSIYVVLNYLPNHRPATVFLALLGVLLAHIKTAMVAIAKTLVPKLTFSANSNPVFRHKTLKGPYVRLLVARSKQLPL